MQFRSAPLRLAVFSPLLFAGALFADSLPCDLSGYKALPGLNAALANDILTLTWDGDRSQAVRLRFAVTNGAPVIREIAVRPTGGNWNPLATDISPEFTIVSGKRRMSHQQMEPLETMGVKVTPEIIEKQKWEAFWDAPLDIPGLPPGGRAPGGNLPLDLPRAASEVHRGTAAYHVRGCAVKTNGMRLEVVFPGVDLGVFTGNLEYTVYKGTNPSARRLPRVRMNRRSLINTTRA